MWVRSDVEHSVEIEENCERRPLLGARRKSCKRRHLIDFRHFNYTDYKPPIQYIHCRYAVAEKPSSPQRCRENLNGYHTTEERTALQAKQMKRSVCATESISKDNQPPHEPRYAHHSPPEYIKDHNRKPDTPHDPQQHPFQQLERHVDQ